MEVNGNQKSTVQQCAFYDIIVQMWLDLRTLSASFMNRKGLNYISFCFSFLKRQASMMVIVLETEVKFA